MWNLRFGWGVRSGSPVRREDCGNSKLKSPVWGEPWCRKCSQVGWCRSKGHLHRALAAAGFPSCLSGQWSQAAAANYFRGWLEPLGNHSHSISLLDPSGVYCWLSSPWLAFSNGLSSSLWHPSSLKSNPWTLFVSTGLWWITAIKIDFIFSGCISELILREYNVLINSKSHFNGWIKQHSKPKP